MKSEKKVTYKVIYLDPTAAPDTVTAFGDPVWDMSTVKFKVGHANGHDNFLILYDVAETRVVK